MNFFFKTNLFPAALFIVLPDRTNIGINAGHVFYFIFINPKRVVICLLNFPVFKINLLHLIPPKNYPAQPFEALAFDCPGIIFCWRLRDCRDF